MEGNIFNIQRFCINDGPGIRTTVFFKGCPLKCVWCHNPESQESKKEIMFYEENCSLCGRCHTVCKNNCHIFENQKHYFDRKECEKCFSCTIFECGTLEIVGKKTTSEDITETIMKDKIFYDNSGGGITLSGGEPLFQFEFALDILKKAKKRGVHTAIETCGFVNTEKIIAISEYTDLFLFDIKETNEILHKKFTGVDNRIIFKNLKTLDKINKKIILRCPIVPNFNDRAGHFENIGILANLYKNVKKIEIEPYHSFGENKYTALGKKENKIPVPSEEEIKMWVNAVKKKTFKEVKIS